MMLLSHSLVPPTPQASHEVLTKADSNTTIPQTFHIHCLNQFFIILLIHAAAFQIINYSSYIITTFYSIN